MANESREPDAAPTDFVAAIISDPKTVPDVQLLYGYIGASSEEKCERLYLSLDLSNYVEIPMSAILHRAPATPQQDSYGGVTVWVKKDAALTYKMAPAAQALAHYFAGAIQAGGAAAWHQPVTPVAMEAAAAVRPIATRNQPQCPYPTEICTMTAGCRHLSMQCPNTAAYACAPSVIGYCGGTPAEDVAAAAAVRPIATRNQPQCPYPTEICTMTAGCRHLSMQCPNTAAYACAPSVIGYCGGTPQEAMAAAQPAAVPPVVGYTMHCGPGCAPFTVSPYPTRHLGCTTGCPW